MMNYILQPMHARVSQMATETKEQMVALFLKEKTHWSPTGITANFLANYCMVNGLPFILKWDLEAGWRIKLLEASDVTA